MYSLLIANNSTEHRLYEEANIQSFLFVVAQQLLVDQGLLIVEVSRSHSGTPHSVELRGRDPAWQHTRISRDKYFCSRRDSNTQSQRASSHYPNAFEGTAALIGTTFSRLLRKEEVHSHVYKSQPMSLSWPTCIQSILLQVIPIR